MSPKIIDCPHRNCSNGVEHRTGRDCPLCAGKGELTEEFAQRAHNKPVKERDTTWQACELCGRVGWTLVVPDDPEHFRLCSECYTKARYPNRYRIMTPAEVAALPF